MGYYPDRRARMHQGVHWILMLRQIVGTAIVGLFALYLIAEGAPFLIAAPAVWLVGELVS